ncbi:MAG: sulfatase [Bryobacteraceae bacterium]
MHRRSFLAASAAAAVSCSRPQPQVRPNILLVVADDQSWAHASAYGSHAVQTPHFDRVAREGVRFTHSFCASPSCTPSRSAILSGRHQWQQREAGVLYGSMPPDLPLYTHLLEDSGYFTGFTGKGWGPGNFGALGLKRNPCGREYNQRKYGEAPPPGIDVRDYAANFQDFLRDRPQNTPFCFWFGSTEPHRLYDPGIGLRMGKKLTDAAVPSFLPQTDAVRSDLLDYYAEIEWFDRQLGRALTALEATGELDRTLVVVTSDNGMPFPRAKVNLYDWGVRMPLAIRWGDRIKGGRVANEFASHVDFAPTFLEAAGVNAPQGMSGRSLLPLLDGKAGPARDRAFTSMERHTMCRPDGAGYPMRALRTAEYLYIRNFAPDRWPTGGEFLSSNRTTHGDIDAGPSKDEVLSARAELCIARRPAEELYVVADDPDQVRNVAQDPKHSATMAKLRGDLEGYLRQTGDPRMAGQDPWKDYVYHQTTGYGASFNKSLSEEVRRQARERPTHKPE